MKVSVKNLKRKFEDIPKIPEFHFPSWDLLYMRDINKLQKWIGIFVEAFDQFEMELREKLREAQSDPSKSDAVDILKDILGE